jgi:hypothetical protein
MLQVAVLVVLQQQIYFSFYAASNETENTHTNYTFSSVVKGEVLIHKV